MQNADIRAGQSALDTQSKSRPNLRFPTLVWNRLVSAGSLVQGWRAQAKRAAMRFIRKILYRAGYILTQRSNYYSPLISIEDLGPTFGRWNRPSALKGIDYDIACMKSVMSDLLSRYLGEFSAIPPYEQLQKVGFGPGYTAVDALTLYMMIRHIKPKRYIEIGSGLSTYYCSLAAARNASEGHPLAITCIEPHPFEKLHSIPNICVIAQPVQDVDVSLFHELQKDDVLFIDSTHVLKIDGDVPFLYLEVLPVLNSGVVTHIHDVPFPYNIPYPPQFWVFGQEWPMLWNEAMVVQAFLSFNSKFRIHLSTPLIRYFDEDFLKRSIPFYESIDKNPNTFSSLWLTRVS